MRICFYNVTASFISGGLETYCWEVGRALSRLGHQVTLVAGDRGSPRHNEVKLVQFPFRIEQSWPNYGTRFRRLMERLSFAYSGGLDHLIKENYDAVIINKPFDFPVLWLAKRRGMCSQTFFRSGGTDFFSGDRFFSKAINHWVSTSQYNAKQIEDRYQHKTTVIHNGVDTDHFKPRQGDQTLKQSLGLSNNLQIIISVGRIVGWKGLHIIIQALVKLPKHIHYVIIGEGPEKNLLKDMSVKSGINDRVHFAGRINHKDLPEWLALGDIFVQPSIGEEAFGISVVEAMSCQLPVLASKNGGMKEIVIDGGTGYLLPPGNVEAWLSTMKTLLSDGVKIADMKKKSRQRAIDHFTWRANAKSVEQLLTNPRNSK